MNRRTSFIVVLASIAGTWAFAGAGLAADDLDSLQKRFKERNDRLVELKKEGKIGETWEGYVETVSEDAEKSVKDFAKEENGDRKKLYELLAEKQQTTPEKVAERNATRNFEKAKTGEYLKGKDGKWKKKE